MSITRTGAIRAEIIQSQPMGFPAEEATISLDAASDTGSSDSDGVTRDTTPTMTGTAPADTVIRIYEDGNFVAETTSDGSGNWSVSLPAQADGEHSYALRWVDEEGDETEADATLDMLIDTTAPTEISSEPWSVDEGYVTTISGADLWFEDDMMGTVTFTLGVTTNGVVLLDGVELQAGDTFTQWDVDVGLVTFIHDGSETTTAGFDFTAADLAGNTTSQQTFSMDVNPTNDAPALTGFAVNLTITEGDGPVLLDADVTFTDAEGNFDGGYLEIIGGEAEDVVSIRDQGMDAGQIGYDADTGEVFYGGVLIGQAYGGCGCAPLAVDFNSDATAEAIEALIENLTYEYQGQDPAASRTLHLSIVDGDGAPATGGMRGFLPGDTPDDFFWYLEAFAATGVNFDGVVYVAATEVDGVRIYAFDEDFQEFVTADEWTIPLTDVFGIPTLVDLDGDGALDVVLNDLDSGEASFWRNTGSGFEAMADPLGVMGAYTTASGDMDGDGDLDLIVSSFDFDTGESAGGLRYFENVDGVLTERTDADNPVAGIASGILAAVGDVDGDGDMDVVTIGADSVSYYVDDGAGFGLVDEAASPFYGLPPFPLSLVDIDSDGYADFFGAFSGGSIMGWNIDTGFMPITVNITPVNADPIADTNMGALVDEGSSVDVTFADLLFIDVDNDPSEVTYTLTGQPAHGQLVLDGVALGLGDTFTQQDIDDGLLSYHHDGGEADSDSFQFDVTDGAGGSSAGHSFGFAINPIDDPTVIHDDAVATTEHVGFSGDVFADNGYGPDADPDGPVLEVVEVNGQAADVGVQITLASGALLTLRADGTFDYDPNGAFPALAAAFTGGSNTRVTDSFTYTLAGGETATVEVEILGEYDDGDRIEGTGGADVLLGGWRDDHFHGEGGSDRIDGGDGVDRAHFAGLSSAYTVTYNTNGSFTVAGEGDSTVLWNVEHAVFDDATVALIPIPGISWSGGPGGEIRVGTAYNDDLRGREGDDSLRGSTGLDALRGGLGDDWLYGQGDNDLLYGDDGSDRIYGGEGVDIAYGGVGDDNIRGDGGDDVLRGEDGADILYGGDGADRIYGGADGDRVYGGSGDDSVYGGDGGDSVWGDLGDDILRGEAGDDFLYGGDGADSLWGGAGIDRVYGGADADQLYGGEDNDHLYGEAGNDSLRGESGHDTLRGGDGNDFLYGGDGDDRMEGGSGIDRIYGQAGADSFVFGAGVLTAPGVSVDRIHDFNASEGDLIDLSGIDADVNTAGDQAFVKVSAFNGVAGEYVLQVRAGYVTALFDTDGDGVADLALRVDGASDGVTGWVL